jgi:hypothetical protein
MSILSWALDLGAGRLRLTSRALGIQYCFLKLGVYSNRSSRYTYINMTDIELVEMTKQKM